MATMQATRSNSKKRDAETAFTVSNSKYHQQRADWEMEEEEDEQDLSSQQESTQATTLNPQIFIDDTLNRTRKTMKTLVHNLLDNTQKIFSGVEVSVASLHATHDKAMNENIERLTKYVEESKKINKDPLTLPLSKIEQRLDHFDQLTSCYEEIDSELASKLNADLHIKRRVNHKSKISHKGAQVALKQMKQASNDNQIRMDTKKFAKAHRDFFKTIHTSQVSI